MAAPLGWPGTARTGREITSQRLSVCLSSFCNWTMSLFLPVGSQLPSFVVKHGLHAHVFSENEGKALRRVNELKALNEPELRG